jgi:hypothetical protein
MMAVRNIRLRFGANLRMSSGYCVTQPVPTRASTPFVPQVLIRFDSSMNLLGHRTSWFHSIIWRDAKSPVGLQTGVYAGHL